MNATTAETAAAIVLYVDESAENTVSYSQTDALRKASDCSATACCQGINPAITGQSPMMVTKQLTVSVTIDQIAALALMNRFDFASTQPGPYGTRRRQRQT